MKKILKFSLVLVAVVSAMNVNAADVDFSLHVKKAEGKTVTFALNEINKIQLSIFDVNDKLINFENVKVNGNLNRTYDLNALPEGTYFLEAESDMKISRYQILVIGNVATLAPEAVSEIYKPVVDVKNGVVAMSITNLKKSPVTIKILNDDYTEIYRTTLLDDQIIAKYFDINSFPYEKYTFVMSYDDKVFSKTVSAK